MRIYSPFPSALPSSSFSSAQPTSCVFGRHLSRLISPNNSLALPSTRSRGFPSFFCRRRRMEFKFRAVDCRPPQQCASSRPTDYWKQGLPDLSLKRNPDIMRKPFEINQAMHSELEMMRLREERLLVEIETQRILKEEARRELMWVEREMALRGVTRTAGYPVHERWGTPFNAGGAPMVHPRHGWPPTVPLESYGHRCLDAAVPLTPIPHTIAHAHDSKRHVQPDKSGLIILEKPDPKLFFEKQKVETPSTIPVNGIHPLEVKKNPNNEWSCALCQVTVLSERTFGKHLQGKKHKRKEASLRVKKANSNSQAAPGPQPKKRRKLLEATETSAEQELKAGESIPWEKTQGTLNPNTMNSNFLSGREDDKQQHESLKGENALFLGKEKFKFWCGMCKVGAYGKEVMDAHVKGKKHKSKLSEADSSVGLQQQPL